MNRWKDATFTSQSCRRGDGEFHCGSVGLSQREREITVKRIPAVPSAVNFADTVLCVFDQRGDDASFLQ